MNLLAISLVLQLIIPPTLPLGWFNNIPKPPNFVDRLKMIAGVMSLTPMNSALKALVDCYQHPLMCSHNDYNPFWATMDTYNRTCNQLVFTLAIYIKETRKMDEAKDRIKEDFLPVGRQQLIYMIQIEQEIKRYPELAKLAQHIEDTSNNLAIIIRLINIDAEDVAKVIDNYEKVAQMINSFRVSIVDATQEYLALLRVVSFKTANQMERFKPFVEVKDNASSSSNQSELHPIFVTQNNNNDHDDDKDSGRQEVEHKSTAQAKVNEPSTNPIEPIAKTEGFKNEMLRSQNKFRWSNNLLYSVGAMIMFLGLFLISILALSNAGGVKDGSLLGTLTQSLPGQTPPSSQAATITILICAIVVLAALAFIFVRLRSSKAVPRMGKGRHRLDKILSALNTSRSFLSASTNFSRFSSIYKKSQKPKMARNTKFKIVKQSPSTRSIVFKKQQTVKT